jgi:hypothetical protein
MTDRRSFLGWLATLPLAEVRIEPVGLGAIYGRFHPLEAMHDSTWDDAA